jgi:hypothetical protein
MLLLKLHHFIPHLNAIMRSVTSYVRFEVFTAVTMKKAVFWIWHGVHVVLTDDSEERITSITPLPSLLSHS